MVGSEDVSLDSAACTAAFDSKHVGNAIAVIVDGLALGGADMGNYTLAQPAPAADITPAALTVAATGHNKPYDGTTDATVTLDSADVVGGDHVSMHYAGATFADKNVNIGIAIAVGGISISGADAGDYALRSATADTTANITPVALTATAHGADKVYDGTTAAGVTLSTDKIGGDAVAAHSTSAAIATKDVGASKTIDVEGISIDGDDAGNCALQNTAAQTTAAAAKGLTITANDQSKPSGQAFACTGKEFAADGLVSGDSVDSVAFTCAGADARAVAGTCPSCPATPPAWVSATTSSPTRTAP